MRKIALAALAALFSVSVAHADLYGQQQQGQAALSGSSINPAPGSGRASGARLPGAALLLGDVAEAIEEARPALAPVWARHVR